MPEITLETLAKSVADLTEAVAENQKGLVDEDVVKRIAEEVVENQKDAGREQQRRNGPTPADLMNGDEGMPGRVSGLQGAARLYEIQSRPAKAIAPLVGRKPDVVEAFQKACDKIAIMSLLCGSEKQSKLPTRVQDTRFYRDEFVPLAQAMDSATSAEGVEYVPRELSAALIERVNLELLVAPLFVNVDMPTNPFDIPARAVSRTRLGKVAENTADTGQTGWLKVTPGTRKVTLTAVKFGGESLVSRDLEEDSLIAILPFIEEELTDYMAADFEDCLVNGDTTGSHQDSDVSASTDPRKNFNGLRKLAISAAKTDLSNAAPTVANTVRANRKKMLKYGVRPADLAHVMSINAYIQLLADSAVLTLEKYGPYATILTGELGKVDGSPIIVSEYVRSDLNASGVYDGTTTTRSELLTVNRKSFAIGERRGLTLQVLRELYAEFDQDAVTASWRKAFAARYTASTEPIVAVAYNVAT